MGTAGAATGAVLTSCLLTDSVQDGFSSSYRDLFSVYSLSASVLYHATPARERARAASHTHRLKHDRRTFYNWLSEAAVPSALNLSGLKRPWWWKLNKFIPETRCLTRGLLHKISIAVRLTKKRIRTAHLGMLVCCDLFRAPIGPRGAPSKYTETGSGRCGCAAGYWLCLPAGARGPLENPAAARARRDSARRSLVLS